MLLLEDAKIEARRRAARGPLATLFDSLVEELKPLLGGPLHVPDAKALLSRAGGRCERDGATLDFDPWSPHRHRCPLCGTIHQGELHDRAWITSYQLWLAERSVHAALFHLLRPDERHAALARDILGAYAERYLRYPNRDNVLGPTRLFFSTYLESIWLLQICIAADLLAQSGDSATAGLVRERIVEPSSSLIADYDEGMSNRQVWNNAALLAAAAMLNDDAAFERRLHGESGLEAHLSRALLADGTWYEGENYHQFALRGLWYGVATCEARGEPPDPRLAARYQSAFAAPFVTALPDFTMPSRKDSQYAVSLRQWRMAELTELGYARRQDPVLAAALSRCYEAGHQRRDTGRASSAADVERNGPGSSLTRADLGWRALLHALPELAALPMLVPRSALLEEQGIAVFRRADDIYVALDFGQSGGGHGHPDRLNVLLSQGTTRWLDDLGTGSYVDPSLHWYRSTLAHNAPLVNGHSQPLRDGVLRAHDEREGLGWVVAETFFPDDDVRLERTLVVAPDYVIDELRWSAADSVRVELPIHLDGDVQDVTWSTATLDGADGLEDGFQYASDARSAAIRANARVVLIAGRSERRLRLTAIADRDVELFSACAPGQPPSTVRRFHVIRAAAPDGAIRSLVSWRPDVALVEVKATELSVQCGSERHVHRRDDRGWHVELFANGARSSIDLDGWRPARDARQPPPLPASRPPTVVRRGLPPRQWWTDMSFSERASLLTFELGERHYRRSEDQWKTAGSPHATIAIGADQRMVVLYAVIAAGQIRFTAGEATNPYDNEHPDTMGAGLQLYVRTPDGSGAWALIPEAASADVRTRDIIGWGTLPAPRGQWHPNDGGYELRVELPLKTVSANEYPIDLDVVINETTVERLRRRGQLVMSGADGEFVYLRGDRHDPHRLLPLVIVT